MTTPLRLTALLLLLCTSLSGCGLFDKQPKQPGKATYSQVSWSDLPKTSDTELLAGFQAWRSACAVRLQKDAHWAGTCQAAAQVPATAATVRKFLEQHLQPYRLSAAGQDTGLITGYYEPIYPGSLEPSQAFPVPVYGAPQDLIRVDLESLYPDLKGKRLRGKLVGKSLQPYADAAQIRQEGVKAPVLAWLKDPMDLQFLQIQGSGRVQLASGRQLRLAYAEQNGHPYRPIGRWLVEQGELPVEKVSMQSIRDWAQRHPERVNELLASNPSYVFFSQQPDSDEAPRGSLNVPLTAGYSVAVDRQVIPLGSLVWLSSSRPDGSPLIRPVAAQDTGGAIVGEVRADLFCGSGEAAGAMAGEMKQKGQLWLLWPKGMALPNAQAAP